VDFFVRFPGLGWEFTVQRVAFSLFGLDIYWYGVLIGGGLVLAMLYSFTKTKFFGIDTDRFLDVVIVSSIMGVLGSRAYYVLFSPNYHMQSLWQFFDLRDGGLGFYGAVVGGVASAYVLTQWKKIKFLPVCDISMLGFLIGQGIGRWGNFFNQEAFGSNTTLPWGMISEETTHYLLLTNIPGVDPYLPVHPTFLYESLWCLLGIILLSLYIPHRNFDGEIALMYVIWNGSARTLIEGLRTDSLLVGSFRVSQVLAALGALAAALVIIIVRLKMYKKNDPDYLLPYGLTQEWRDEYAAILQRQKMDEEKIKEEVAKLPVRSARE